MQVKHAPLCLTSDSTQIGIEKQLANFVTPPAAAGRGFSRNSATGNINWITTSPYGFTVLSSLFEIFWYFSIES